MLYEMEWLCVLAVFALVIVSVKYVLYRRQIKDICRQMEFLLKENTNKRIQTDLRSKEIDFPPGGTAGKRIFTDFVF